MAEDKSKPLEEAKPTAKDKKKSVVVLQEFRDINDFSITHEVGDNVSHFDENRLEDLRNKGIVE